MLSYQTNQFSPYYGTPTPAVTAQLTEAARVGFTAVGFDLATLMSDAAPADVADLAALLRELGLVCTDIVPILVGGDAAQNLATVRDVARVGSALCASIGLLTLGVDAFESGLRGHLDACVSILDGVGLRTAVEFVPYLPLDTVATAYELCAALGFDRASLAVDTFHVFAGDQLAALTGIRAEEIALVQISDAVLPPDITTASRNDLAAASRNARCLPGRGNLDLPAFTDWLRGTGYTGVVSTEVLSASVRQGEPAEFIAPLYAAFESWH